MLNRHFYISLFFTFICSLASGQWESDQFLFQKQTPATRLKTKKRNKPSAISANKDSASKPRDLSTSMELQKAEEQKNSTTTSSAKINNRNLASTDQKNPITLDLKIGAIDFTSRTSMESMNFSKSAFAFNGVLSLPLKETDLATLFYTSSSEVKLSSNHQARWEDWGFQYKREGNFFNQKVYWGMILRQYSWWRANDLPSYSLQSVNGLGFCGTMALPSDTLWSSALNISLLPFVSNPKGSLRGGSLGIEWSSLYQLTTGRSLVISVGYEGILLQNPSDTQYKIHQNLLKMFIGYRLASF